MKKISKFILTMVLYASYFASVVLKSNTYGNILSPIVTVIAAYYIRKGYYLKEKETLQKRAGILLFLSVFSWFLCDAMWCISDLILKTDPNENLVITYGYSATNLFMISSFVVLGYQELKRWRGIQVLIDAFAVSLCSMILVWVIFLNRNLQNAMLVKNDWVAMLSLFIDLLIFIWNCIWFFSIRKGKMALSLKITLFGSLVFVIVDIIYYYEYYYSVYEPNSLLDGGYVMAFAFLAIGSILKEKMNVQEAEVETNWDVGKRNGVLLFAAPLLLIIFAGIQAEYLLMLVSIIMVYFVISNYTQKNIYRDELLVRERNLNAELEGKVKERTKELNDLLKRDVVTGLLSRRYFLEQINKQAKQLMKEETILVFYIDVNKYKLIKTMFGNDIGEKVLTEVGKRLNKYSYGEEDLLASYGEDVFIISMKGIYSIERGMEIAEHLIQLSSDLYKIEEYEIRVTVNIGVSMFHVDARSCEELIKNADLAMLQAKSEGYNQARAFDEELGEIIFEKNRIEIMLKKVICEEEFFLCYQPQVLAVDGSLIGFEALIRWKTKGGEWISPGQFIPIAEETGFIKPIGGWVMQKAIQQIAVWQKKSFYKLRMAINVSVKQLNEKKFILDLKDTLKKYDVAPESIEIEITESIELEENKEIIVALKKIRDMGISIAIDDFGTGYSSLYYLKNLPVNRIKIAKPLVDHIAQDSYDYAIVQTAVRVAKVKGIHVIAEGVETKEQWECLKTLECDEIQGYYFARPMLPEQAYEQWIKSAK
ncbi:putative bifunctional diguanylate cyclase/phosphodiesterase [Anaeromicropila populeti]|uniref:putative bifunctional diguanylate cyclase/phosphodiesterase n=1 Tax=Anaeromicropila populeti TaxID=37658 RepID=UPI0015A62A5B|nr:bifunctional diguanylate cyclase/phosphodiesterase [Anaeromicropila populeti]